jgi:hypothetical protein
MFVTADRKWPIVAFRDGPQSTIADAQDFSLSNPSRKLAHLLRRTGSLRGGVTTQN